MNWFSRARVSLALLVLALAILAGSQSAPVQAQPIRPVAGQAAIDALGQRLPDVAQAYGLSRSALADLLEQDPTLHVDANDELLYVDHDDPDDILEHFADQHLVPDNIPVEQTFLLHSLPGASHTIYLDFDGHTTSGTTWNSAYGVDPIVSPAYDIDGDPSTFNSTEISRIQATWQIVAEDFRPFNVNVTTEDPGSEALRDSGSGDTAWGTRVVITDDTFASCGCGGHAYIGSFDDPLDEPVFVYNTSLTGVAEASSHEVGHALLLSHDGTSTSAYYWGHGSGATSWGPIMGASYNRSVTQWSQGEYFDANNGGSGANYGNGPDDLAVIASLTNGNGFGYRSDDHGFDLAGSSALTAVGTSVSGTGIIEGSSDVDALRFTTGAGQVDLSIQPFTPNTNLDVLARLYDANDNLLATSDPSTLSASFSLSLSAGTYYVTVEGTGFGSPLSDPPSGYTEYGSLGQYDVSGTIVDPGGLNNPPTFDSDPVAEADAAVDEAYSGSLADDASDLEGDPLSFSKLSGPTWLSVASNGDLSGTPASTDLGLNSWSVEVSDGQGGSDQASLEIMVVDPPDFIDFEATGEIAGLGTVSGSYLNTQADDGSVQTITETENGGRPILRHSRLEHRWTFGVQSGVAMALHANAWADASSDGDDFELAYSTDNSSFTTLGTLDATSDQGEQVFALPSNLDGTVYLRLTDTDRSEGNRSLDSVYVDHLYIRSETQLPDPPAAPSSLIAVAAGSSAIDLSWTDNATNEDGFEIERSLDGASWSLVATAPADATNHTDSGLSASTSYQYRARAINVGGTSAWSNTASATTLAGASISLDLSGSKYRGNHIIDLIWSGASSSDVDIFRDGALLVTTPNDGAYTDETNNNGKRTYTYQVCESGSSVCSDPVDITVN